MSLMRKMAMIALGAMVISFVFCTSIAETQIGDYLVDFVQRNGSNVALITRYTGTGNEIVMIPSILGGQPVVEISRNAFSSSIIKEIIIPESVKSIDWGAFNCGKLEKVTFQGSLKS